MKHASLALMLAVILAATLVVAARVPPVRASGTIYIRADGKVKKRKNGVAKDAYGTAHKIGPEELEKVCQGRPDVLIIGSGEGGLAELTKEGQEFLRERGVSVRVIPGPAAAEEYNRTTGRKAALFHVTC